MHFIMTLPDDFQTKTVKDLLELEWLIPRKTRHFLRTKKHLLVNGRHTAWHELVHAKDRIELTFDPQDFNTRSVTFGDANLVDVLYEDEHIIVVNKPEGMKTHANQPDELALLNHVSAYLQVTAHVVHRLDQATSGAIVFAKNQFVLPILGRMLEEKQIMRRYHALISGQLPHSPYTIDKPIGRDRSDQRKRLVSPNGKRAITHVVTEQVFATSSLVSCQLETGRTHQIRVHLSDSKHAILGDPLYSTIKADRLMLHAYRLTFIHPFTRQAIQANASSESFDRIITSQN